ncbi:glutamate--tRNA ligase [Candidatus Woesearchaeota archaeon]|nr:glutamate--tRNA ligase [Candidatus Woesearchaeota archaeon]MBW3005274.1 glutamate--tRNA ligase [Candidatus Woesearchaeota archaeon]
MDKKIKADIRNWALQNALKYSGTANQGAVIGKLLSANPDLKKELKTLGKEISTIISEVNKLGEEKQRKELEKNAPELLEEKPKEKREGLKPLKDAKEGKVAVRFAPSPSGPLHLGHAYGLSINSEYARMYKGKLFLRIEDTDPSNIYEPGYELVPTDAKWLTKDNVAETLFQSDRLGYYYDHMEKLISAGNAYVCTCDPDEFREMISKKKACPCRELSIKEQEARWAKMFGEYKPGEAVCRIKTDVAHKNPAMRDWPAMRINDHVHPRQGTKHRVWPLMNFSVAIDDHLLGLTHVINGKEHADGAKRQKYIFDYFKWKRPTYINWGRINFVGLELSCSKTKQKIEYGEYDDWDDIRLPFMPALRRRGFQPGAFIKFAVDIGLTLTDKTVTKEEFFKTLEAFNKEIIDPVSDRYFFVEDPIEVTISKAPTQDIALKLHPDKLEKGMRVFKCNEKFYLARADNKILKANKLYRLMDCLNFKKKGQELVFEGKNYSDYKDKGEMIIHWLPVSKDLVDVEVLMPDKTTVKGLGEAGLSKLKAGDIVQLERFGFCRLDAKKGKKLKFWFTHR